MRTAAFRLSEVREQINTAQAAGKPPEELEALRQELIGLESRYREELQAEPPPHPTEQPGGHGAEVRALLGRAELGNYVGAAVENRAVEGAEAELSAALETRTAENGGVMIPWELLDPGPGEQRAEVRQDAATALTATSGVGTVQDMIIARVFAETAAAFLGVRMKGVGVGQHSFPIITAGQTADLKAAGAATYAAFLSAYGGGVDGRYARSLMEVKLLVGAQTYGHAAAVTNQGSGATAVQYAQDSTGGLQGSALVPAPDSNVQQAILAKTGPGGMDNSVCLTWPGVEMIRDPYSRASQGEVALTAISLVDFALIRAAGYKQLAFRLAA